MPSFRFENGELIEEPPRAPRPRYAPITSPKPPAPPANQVRARHPLTPQSVAERGGAVPGTVEADTAVRLLALQREQSRERARMLRELAPLWIAPANDEEAADDRAESAVVAAVALRTTTSHASTLIREAHTAVHHLPALFARLEAGDLPVEWHQRILRTTREFTPAQLAEVDQRVSAWDLASIPVQRFRRELRVLVAWLHHAGETTPRPQDQREVALEGSPVDDGTATVRITGPVPEILSLSRRLDASARAIQDQQRHALADGAPIPFDPDGQAAATGAPLTLAALRYLVLTRSVLETGGIEVPGERFRISVMVPVMTLMGHSDAPALIDGTIPIPASMARMIAADQPLWHRILTDPVTGAHIPATTTSYRPPASMLEQLRIQHPVCAVPGCIRPSTSRAEADHITEYDHTDPTAGGQTCLANLHLLCFTHHRLKTRGRIDPVRGPDGTTHWRIGATTTGTSTTTGASTGRPRATASIPANRDLTTPLLAQALHDAWSQYQWGLELTALDRNGTLDHLHHPDHPDHDDTDHHRTTPPPF
ncbi:HNH endonuclease signature motif containing protein [Brachybacterium sp. p3-SID957]|uniref:HNH endonuclease signature motif containing protein n=1 Tax=Brachybacterium sp. p3-SID957 TaxID=2916049 RepID=UPI00223B029E|nr:HNH endonuclease signature motif containing protein [Brachybacterium sp. p3-SID957]MCT1775182.1 HNH endonuclease [Brachybacterium sp. p3-SID957]